jgi:hypothetical protein
MTQAAVVGGVANWRAMKQMMSKNIQQDFCTGKSVLLIWFIFVMGFIMGASTWCVVSQDGWWLIFIKNLF